MSDDKIYEGMLKPRKVQKPQPGHEPVISGIAGRFPESDNLHQLRDNFFNKKDLVTDDGRRWKLEHPDIPQRAGKINGVDKFDALFFGVHFKQAHTMDPMCRLLMEHAYEAILDAGVNPRDIRGSNTGVFMGACFSESEKTWFYDKLQVNGFGITGCSRAMLANRISYFLGVTGPSYSIDTACSSSLYALEHAYRAMEQGLCDAALVGGANLCLHPYVSMQFFKLGVLSIDGKCKVFDESANGYVRSETVSVLFLQKAKDAKRIYATLVHAKTNCDGYKEQGVTFPSTFMQSILLKEFYMECGLSPSIVSYIEAHGTGTTVGDPEEVNAIDRVFSPGRKKPLKIGSCKTNMGHAEPASGMASIAKVIIAMETGFIAPNLHFKTPRKSVKAFSEGRIQVIVESTPWENDYAGVNSFGFGGANGHVLLKSNSKKKVNNGAPNDDLPRLVTTSARTEEGVQTILNDLNSRPVDVEYVALYHNIHSKNINGHVCRGYTILPPRGVAETPIKHIQTYNDVKRPIWFVFSGMGSQWPGMGENILRLPIFAQAIQKCDNALKPFNVDIYNVITNKDKSIFDTILHSFVGIAAIQIALVDVLRSVGIEPDKIIGHSVGELGCAYADGCFTAEQMILAAYSRGLATIESKIIHGSMAAVGLGYQELKNMCPPDIDIACHNSSQSATISGPAESMKAFVAQLQAKNIFAKEVQCSNIPYHSRYITSIGEKLIQYLKKVIPEPKARSSKWLSTSVPMEKWNTPSALYSSAEYHTNNLLNHVLFEETSSLIPKNAIVIEIAPYGLLQAILRRSLPSTVEYIPLMQRGHKDNVEVLLNGIGKMFVLGMHPQLANIYPAIQFPVSRSTPMISPLIKWDHSDSWYVTSYDSQMKTESGERTVKISLSDSDYENISGHIIDGRNLFPATGYLTLVWESIGMMLGELYSEVSVVFEDVQFLRATNMPQDGTVEFTITITKGTGRFEIVEGNTAVVTGYARATSNPAAEKINLPLPKDDEEEVMSNRDVYKELRLRGYQYTGSYRSIQSATISGTKGHILWRNDWASFMDNVLQMQILSMDTRGLFVPTRLKKLVIDVKSHLGQIKKGETDKQFAVYVDKIHGTTVCGGIEVRNLQADAIARKKSTADPVIEEYKFVPYCDGADTSIFEIVKLVTHICKENSLGVKTKTIEYINEADNIPNESILSPLIFESYSNIPLLQPDISIISTNTQYAESLKSKVNVIDPKKVGSDMNADLAIGHRLLEKSRADNLRMLLSAISKNGFILTREHVNVPSNIESISDGLGLKIVLAKRFKDEMFILLKKHQNQPLRYSVIHVSNNNFNWVEDMQIILSEEIDNRHDGCGRVLFVGQGEFDNGLMGFINCLQRETANNLVRGLLIQDPKAPKFSLDNPFYSKQIEKDLFVNVLRENNTWGSYRHLPLPPLEIKPVQHAIVNQLVRGDLSSLTWIEGPLQYGMKNLINVLYFSLNFKDIMLSTGKLPLESVMVNRFSNNLLGFEYCGIDASGRRVMGMVTKCANSNLLVADPYIMWEIPENWSLEDGATVPVVYGTCIYAFYIHGKIKKGDKVLIHAGSGGVGQAAINLALSEGCEIFTTVGTEEKRRFIREKFPQIPEDHIGNSRDTSFEQMIMRMTNGVGVDIVLNSLAEEKLLASVNCLAPKGCFLEIGKFDLSSDNKLGMKVFLKEVSFHGVMLDNVIDFDIEVRKRLHALVDKYIKNGAIKPLVRTVFPRDQVETAYRHMAAGKHIGKVLVKVHNDKESINSPIPALQRYYCHKDRSYLILGGLGGFGLELADWLVLHGARNLVFTSRTGLKNGYQKMRVNLWQSYGVKVVIINGKDASKLADCQYILETASKLAPLDGVFNLAVTLHDGIWNNQKIEWFEELFRTKAWATKNLDILVRKLCPVLRHFVVFSSVVSGLGNAGQTNYGMSNSVMERICERRSREGLPALCIQWGAVGDVGLVADMNEDQKELIISGTLQQRITSCLQELENFMIQNRPVVSSIVVAEKKAGDGSALNIIDTVINIMSLKDLKGVSLSVSLAELGMDSMMAVEIKQTLEREFQIFLTSQDIRNLNFAKLQEMSDEFEQSQDKSEVAVKIEEDILTGMKLILHIIGKDSIEPQLSVKLPSKQESDKNEIFFIPGAEGVASVFSALSPKVKAPVTCLQLGIHNTDGKSIFDIADDLLPHVLNKSKGSDKVTIVGYSYGAVVAIELMRKLEAKNIKGQLILIDGSPLSLKKVMKSHFPHENREELEYVLIMEIINMFSPKSSSELSEELKKCKNWNEKVDALIARIPNSELNMPAATLKALISSVYNRILAFDNYDISKLPQIKAPIVLLRPTSKMDRNLSNDYNLSKVTSGKVTVNHLKGNHVTILENDDVANIINGYDIDDKDTFTAELMKH